MHFLYFDGGSRGNGRKNPNARAGYGYVVYDSIGGRVADGWDYVGAKTNNYAEYSGLINGMRRAISLGITALTVRGDSNMVIKQMTGEFGANNPDMKILNAIAKELSVNFIEIKYEHVYRENNKEADRLSNVAMDNPKPESECENMLSVKKDVAETKIIMVKKRNVADRCAGRT